MIKIDTEFVRRLRGKIDIGGVKRRKCREEGQAL
jgi:hypothetical protein